MKKRFLFFGLLYGGWVLINIIITVLKIGDAGVNAHLALMFTGIPVSLFSLFLPSGSLEAVLAAGFLGLAQWGLVVKLWGRRSADSA